MKVQLPLLRVIKSYEENRRSLQLLSFLTSVLDKNQSSDIRHRLLIIIRRRSSSSSSSSDGSSSSSGSSSSGGGSSSSSSGSSSSGGGGGSSSSSTCSSSRSCSGSKFAFLLWKKIPHLDIWLSRGID